MSPDVRLLSVLRSHGVPFVIVGGHAVNVSLEWLRRLKLAAGRPKDLLDLENLAD